MVSKLGWKTTFRNFSALSCDMRWGHSLDIADDNPVLKPQLLATHEVSILYNNYTLIKLITNRSL